MTRNKQTRKVRARRPRRALTLIESLIALSIFSVGILAVSQWMARSGQVALRTELETLATVACQSELDRLASTADSRTPAPANELFNLTVREFPTELQYLVRVEVTASLRTNSTIPPLSVSRLMHRTPASVPIGAEKGRES